MNSGFHLVAIIAENSKRNLLRIPLHQSARDHFNESWNSKYSLFVHEMKQIDYRPGYRLEKNQCFRFHDFEIPSWMAKYNSQTALSIDEIGGKHETYNSIQGILALTRKNVNEEMMLFQDFSQSKVINPGLLLRPNGNTFDIAESTGFLLDRHLSAVYLRENRTLLFRNFRAVNSFLPVFDYYKKASEQAILDLLNHKLFVAEDPSLWAKTANQWFRSRFTSLKHSGILDRFSAYEIKDRSMGYGIPIEIMNDKIVFPSDSESAKELLRFLNEEYFRGAVSDAIFRSEGKRLKGA